MCGTSVVVVEARRLTLAAPTAECFEQVRRLIAVNGGVVLRRGGSLDLHGRRGSFRSLEVCLVERERPAVES